MSFPAVLTLLSALSGAIIGQIVSHTLTKNREEKNRVKEIYTTLYFSSLIKIFLYFDIKFNFRKLHDVKHDVDEEKLMEEIIKEIEGKLYYLTPNTLFKMENVKSEDYFEDQRGDPLSNKYQLVSAFLDDLYKYQMDYRILDERHFKKIMNYIFLYKFLCFLHDSLSDEEAYLILSNKFEFRDHVYQGLYLHLKEIEDEEDIYHPIDRLNSIKYCLRQIGTKDFLEQDEVKKIMSRKYNK
ncbi:hypothetical protein ACQCWA_00190 [Rossellomorea aquimaris]|uniref:hypothetical protein n=1 Tax=Rossellomorea aquimaris TaxID=189382 RepID=UPI003CE88791